MSLFIEFFVLTVLMHHILTVGHLFNETADTLLQGIRLFFHDIEFIDKASEFIGREPFLIFRAADDFCVVILLAGVFAFFGIHTLMWFIRAYLENVGKGSGGIK